MNVRAYSIDGALGAVCCALIAVPFVITFVLDFGFHNDYSTFSYDNHRCCLGYPETQHLFVIGRPLGAVLLNVFLLPFSSIHEFIYGRVFSVLTLCVLWWLTYRIFRRNSNDPIVSAAAALAIALLPSMLLFVTGWGTGVKKARRDSDLLVAP